MKNKIHIKNMVCQRCVYVVETILNKLSIEFTSVELGEVIIVSQLNSKKFDLLQNELQHFGFEIITDNDEVLIEKIKISIINYVNLLADGKLKGQNLSDYISEELGKNYNSLSKLFSQLKGRTLESYYLDVKIEKVKELLNYNELNLSEISALMGYSSVHYLSNQFKKITGCSVTEFRNTQHQRKSIDKLDDNTENRT